ncbi:MAG: methyltransferase domain-containing protein [Candidatus Eisenbacteria bacterium]|nr:methyltransferase domain-containing protein [Candidatus Latescibacterota bacterium]MBD3301986.1 methyltransferase domain-containing protein [Candidatus Eisenbacteria bacterium]
MGRHPDEERIQMAVRARYRRVARSAEGEFAYPTGAAGAEALGYDPVRLAEAPPELLRSFCGVGNPFALGPLAPGEVILDVGCGTGLDLFLASREVGGAGRACGVDLTPEMADAAAANLARSAVENVEVRVARAEELPYEAEAFDVVLSNGVLNLSPGKEGAFGEIFRVLRPGGRLQFADVVLDGDLPAEVAGSLKAWSD